MRMEEQSKGRYNKYPDKIDAQLIRILNRYFNDVGRKDLNLVDAIIDEVMQKIKEELGISSTPATADYIASKDVKVNVPTERLKKDISLSAGEDIELMADKNCSISHIQIGNRSRRYKHIGGYGKYNLGPSEIVVEIYHDIEVGTDILRLYNNSSNEIEFSIIVYS